MLLQNRVALVTGGGSGFGRAIALRFAQEGARVAVSGRRRAPLDATVDAIRKAGGEALAIAGDATVEADVEAMVRGTVERFGALDVLVNNAGAVFGRVTAEECAPDDLRRTLEANLMSAFLCSRAALPALRRRRGSIINVASMGGLKAQRRHLPYSVAKAAVVHMTKCMALDHAAEGIRINCICPAYIETDINRDHLARMRRSGEIRELERAHPLGLGGTPEDVAAAAVYLASPQARWNTGCCLPVDGGVSATI
ncbi:MAG TPA: SDR family oxidoreductase [Methylomirabilota bacterium]|nr:SDR family oxidoreductase [Methylomirabilota bacterium]